ncbi:GNAT family N-acetyltransferase [Anaerosporobacter faecicola]|uniref:GNAT family N-acetyltransferase n=1 Tax=Anaerosporobacter faecicola TaxID=2718714 RepID=UPI001EE617F7|nr:GNAT family protein [Anaerosporobacter faecicola]
MIEMGNVRIETKNLIIRNFECTDEADLCEYMLQRVDAEFEGYPDFTAEKVKEEITFRSGSDEFFAIELKEEHKVIGNVYFGKRDFNTRELGYVLNTKYHRKGFGSEACKAMVEYGFDKGIHRVYAECAPQNTASWKLMEKIGLQREAFFKKNVSFHQDEQGNPIYWDTYVYATLNPNELV